MNKSWKKQPTTHQLYVHLHPISQTILESQRRHVFFNTACCFEQILEEADNNTPTVRPLTSYLTNHPGKSTKTCFFSTQLAVLNKSWKKQPTTHQLYVHLHPISQTLLESQRRHVFWNTACCFEQILEEAANNTPTVRPLTSYLTNHPGKSTKHVFLNTACCFEQILEEADNNTPTVRPLTSYLTNHPVNSTKTCFFEHILLFLTNPGRSSQQHTNCTSTYILSHKPSWKVNEHMFFEHSLLFLDKSWKKQPTTHQLYVHLHPISQIIMESQRRHVFLNTACCFEQILDTSSLQKCSCAPTTSHITNNQEYQVRHAQYNWKSKDELLNDVLHGLIHSHGKTSMDHPAKKKKKTYILQLCADTGFRVEFLPSMMADRDWWWQIYIYIYI